MTAITKCSCTCSVESTPSYTELFISPSGISELDCATTKPDTAERSISIGRESLQDLFVLEALAYFQVPPLGGSREEKLRSRWIRKRSVSWNLPKLSQLWLCNGGFGSCTTQNHLQTKQFVNGTRIPAEWLPVRCETNRPSGPIGPEIPEGLMNNPVLAMHRYTNVMSVTGRLRQDSNWNLSTTKVTQNTHPTAGSIVTINHHGSLKINNNTVVFLLSFVPADHDPPQAEQSRLHFQLQLSRFLYLFPLVWALSLF